MEKYNDYFKEINKGLKEFSKFLNSDCKIPYVDFADTNSCCNLTINSWGNIRFPNSGYTGVYLIFGYKKSNKKELGVYVGKASHNSYIGVRLHYHLYNDQRDKRIYPMNDKEGNEYLLDFIATIPMGKLNFFAPALEEFLIYYLQDKKVNLINTVGREISGNWPIPCKKR